jgi:hypothetical protein
MSVATAIRKEQHPSGAHDPFGPEGKKTLELWSSLSEGEKEALLPELLLRSASWRALNRTNSTRAVDNWLLLLFHRAKLNFWE